jgi:polar amino acid transport system substrate-binding protein
MKCALALWLAFFNPVVAKSSDTLQEIRARKELFVGLQQGYVPFGMRTPDGGWSGYEIEMMRAFAARLGVKATFVDTKWEGIIPSLHAKKFDVIVSGMTITAERAKAVLFSEPYLDSSQVTLVSKAHIGKVQRLSDLDQPGVQVVVELGTTGDFYATRVLKKAKVIRMDLESDAANAVLLGKLDAMVFDKPFLALFQRRHAGKVLLLDEVLNKEGLGLAARKKDVPLVAEFNQFIKEWKASGEQRRVERSYFEQMAWLKDFPNLK